MSGKRAVPAIAGLLLAGLALQGCSSGVDVDPPQGAPQCAALAKALPEEISGVGGRVATNPDSPLVAAWGDPAVVLRCGVAEAEASDPTASAVNVNGIDWVPVEHQDAWTFTTYGRRALVEVIVPKSVAVHPPEVLVDLAAAVSKSIPAVPES